MPFSTSSAALARDAADPLRGFRDRFIAADDESLVYLDGNSLGRPPRDVARRMNAFIEQSWGTRLIRGWDEGWFDAPIEIGDRLARLTLGAAAGQTIVADSTTVSLYKLVRAALTARPDRHEIVIDRDNFPTDRYVAEGIAAETGATVRWIQASADTGVSLSDLTPALGPDTAVVLLSHVAYRSGYLADIPTLTNAVHDAGALVVWDLCHSAGVVEIELDRWGVDYATGCTYKYLNGGPGSPAFLYVRTDLIETATPPISGWMGARDSFAMGQGYTPAGGIRRFISGTPPVLGMLPLTVTLDLIEEAGIAAIREKSIALTEFGLSLVDEHLIPQGATLSSPRISAERGGHITIDHPQFASLMPKLWAQGVLPDFRQPSGIRLGMSPLSTSFAEVENAILTIAGHLKDAVE